MGDKIMTIAITVITMIKNALAERDESGERSNTVTLDRETATRLAAFLSALPGLVGTDNPITTTNAAAIHLEDVADTLLTATEKLRHDLAYRMPGTGRPLSHVVLARGQAIQAIEALQRVEQEEARL
jgi:hypothetical protein